MKKCIAFIIAFVCASLTFAGPITAVGYWKTIDDKTGKALSIVRIYKTKSGKLNGKIFKILKVAGQKPSDRCKACEGMLHNKPVLGLRIIWGMQREAEGHYVGGRVLDPKSGSIYRGRLAVMEDGCQLDVRGYIGLPLFGRTETWDRVYSKQCRNRD